MSARSGEFLGCLNLRDVITWPILCMWRDVPPREVGGDQVGWDGMKWSSTLSTPLTVEFGNAADFVFILEGCQ